ncbi:MAG: hypothetical protein GXX82_07935 [Syntrophorhabdus sp.]|nr:hypothetical protein [Syntrophorhabdus sp.]
MMSCLRKGKRKWIVPAIILMAGLGGCVVHYEKPGMTQAEWARDKAYCEQVAEKEYARKGTRVCDEVDACLIAKGWKRSQ